MEEKRRNLSLPPIPIGSDDYFQENVEKLVSLPKVATELIGERRTHHAPNEVVLRVKAISEHSKRLKVIATKAGGKWFISLVTEGMDILIPSCIQDVS